MHIEAHLLESNHKRIVQVPKPAGNCLSVDIDNNPVALPASDTVAERVARVVEVHLRVDQSVDVDTEACFYLSWVLDGVGEAGSNVWEELSVENQVWQLLDVESGQ